MYRYKVIKLIARENVMEKATFKLLCNVPDYRQAVNICKANKNTYVIRSDNEIMYRNIDLPFSTIGIKF